MGTLMLKIAGELGTKSARTRRRFLRVLTRNVRRALDRRGAHGDVENRWSRLLVETDAPGPAREALSHVFGLHSVSEVVTLPFTGLDDLVGRAASLYGDRVAGQTFAVRVKRSGEQAFGSRDLAVGLGSALLPASGGVDLDHPQVEVPLELANGEAHAVLEASPGVGGLPVGTGGRAVALFSGGFDSPVATWMAMRRGTEVELLVCDLGGCGEVDAAVEVGRAMSLRWALGIEPPVHVIDFAPVVSALRDGVEGRLRQVVLKRAMYRAATLLGRRLRADAIVTGESLGQVSTQTLRNLAVAERAAGIPVLRPLIGMDKQEIMARAREIGTHDASLRVQEHCSIAEGRVETAARVREVISAEGGVDDGYIRAAVDGRKTIDLVAWEPGPLPSHIVEEVPAGAVVVDVREPPEGPTVGELRLPFSRLAEWSPGLDRSRTYLFVCSAGGRSEIVAHELAGRGVRAFSLAGGVDQLPTSVA